MSVCKYGEDLPEGQSFMATHKQPIKMRPEER